MEKMKTIDATSTTEEKIEFYKYVHARLPKDASGRGEAEDALEELRKKKAREGESD